MTTCVRTFNQRGNMGLNWIRRKPIESPHGRARARFHSRLSAVSRHTNPHTHTHSIRIRSFNLDNGIRIKNFCAWPLSGHLSVAGGRARVCVCVYCTKLDGVVVPFFAHVRRPMRYSGRVGWKAAAAAVPNIQHGQSFTLFVTSASATAAAATTTKHAIGSAYFCKANTRSLLLLLLSAYLRLIRAVRKIMHSDAPRIFAVHITHARTHSAQS